MISAGSEIPPGWEKLPDMLGGAGGRDVVSAAVVGCQIRTGCGVVVVGLGFAGWLGIVKGAVGVAREEGPCSLQIFLSNCQELCVVSKRCESAIEQETSPSQRGLHQKGPLLMEEAGLDFKGAAQAAGSQSQGDLC